MRATGPEGYVHFHGRKREKRWNHDHTWERCNYTYTQEELSERVPRLERLDSYTEITRTYANNFYRGQSLHAADKLRGLLGMDRKRAGQMWLI